MALENIPRCSRGDDTCVSCKKGRCIALNDTLFKRKNGEKYDCPFYRDKRTMTSAELEEYERVCRMDTRKK